MICGYDNFAGEKVFNILRTLMICVYDNFAGEKVFEYFEDIDDLRWKTSLQAKKSLNVFRIMMTCG